MNSKMTPLLWAVLFAMLFLGVMGALVLSLNDNSRVFHVTCPQGIYSGDVHHTLALGWVDVETGHAVSLPNTCAWEQIK